MIVMNGTKINKVAILSIAAATLLTLGICTAGFTLQYLHSKISTASLQYYREVMKFLLLLPLHWV